MKKILYTILCLFLVCLVPSVMAVAPTCSISSDLAIVNSVLTLPYGTTTIRYVDLGGSVDISVDIENIGTTPITLAPADFKVYLYDSAGTTQIGTTALTISTAFASTGDGGGGIQGQLSADETETFEGTATMPTTVPVAYQADHNFILYIVVDDIVITYCTIINDGIIVNKAPNAISSITNKIVNEDSALSFTFTASDPDTLTKGDSLTYTLNTIPSGSAPSGLSVVATSTGGTITWTPVNSQVGLHNLLLTASDNYGGTATRTFTINVINTNDAPTLSTISTKKVQQDVAISDIILPAATEIDVGDMVSYSLNFVAQPEESTFLLTYFNSATRTISGWTPNKGDVGELKLRLTATDLSSITATTDFLINVYPKTMCELGDIGNILEVTIDSPSDGDSFGPGDTINIEATVENGAADDKDIIVKAVLYDIESNKKIEEVESDDENIDTDEDFNFELKLQIPLDDEEYGGDYVIYVKAYEDGKEDEQCRSEMVEIDLGRESHKVTIQSITITPSKVAPGNKVDVLVRAINTGKKEEAGVTVKLRNADLDIDLTSDARDLGAFDESGSSYTFRFAGVKIPSDASAKTYDLEAFVLFEEGAKSTSYIDSPVYKASSDDITIEGATTSTSDLITIGSAQEIAKGVLRIPVTITNPDKKTLTVSLINIDWAEPVSEKIVTGNAETVNFDLELKDDVEEGSESFTVQVKANGEVISTKAKSVSITEDMMVGSGFVFSYGTVLFVIGDIVLIIVAIFFIKLIFSGRSKRPKVREVKL